MTTFRFEIPAEPDDLRPRADGFTLRGQHVCRGARFTTDLTRERPDGPLVLIYTEIDDAPAGGAR